MTDQPFNDDDRAREIITGREAWVDGYIGRANKRAKEGGYEPAEPAELEDTARRKWAEHHPALLAMLPEAVAAT